MATLKISDLSVGDWVRYETMPTKVMTINGFDSVVRGKASNGNIVIAHIDCFEPIPITAEILVKNRIHKTYEDDNYAIFRGDGLWAVKYSDGDWELSIPPVGHVDIRYIHQLQHALRLAGVDQEITL